MYGVGSIWGLINYVACTTCCADTVDNLLNVVCVYNVYVHAYMCTMYLKVHCVANYRSGYGDWGIPAIGGTIM